MRGRLDNLDLVDLSGPGPGQLPAGVRGQVDEPMMRVPATELARSPAALPVNKNLGPAPDAGPVMGQGKAALHLLQGLQTALGFGTVHRLLEIRRRRSRPGRILEAVAVDEAHGLDEIQGRQEIGLALAREADDQIRGERNAGDRALQFLGDSQEFIPGIASAHPLENRVRTALQRDMYVRAKMLEGGVGLDQRLVKEERVGTRVANALKPGHAIEFSQQFGEGERAGLLAAARRSSCRP